MIPETLKAIADRWTAHTTHTTDVPDLVEEIVRQAEQIRRLREAVMWATDGWLDCPDKSKDENWNRQHDAARAILKETAP